MLQHLSSGRLVWSALALLSLAATLASSHPMGPTASSDIAITIAANRSSVTPGQQITYKVTMTNLGPSNATSVDTVFHLPDQLVMVRMTCDRGISPDTPACEYGPLAAGSTVVSTLVAKRKPGTIGHAKTVSVAASVFFEEASEVDPNTSNNRASVMTWLVGR